MAGGEAQEMVIMASFVIHAESGGVVVTEATPAAVYEVAYDPADDWCTAMHEAGHAVAATVLGIPVEYVQIGRRDSSDGRVILGATRIPPYWIRDIADAGLEVAKEYMIQILAGPIAQEYVDPGCVSLLEGTSDWNRFEEFVARLAGGKTTWLREGADGLFVGAECREEFGRLKKEVIDEACTFVQKHLPVIARVAGRLLERKRLSGAEVTAIVEEVGQQAAKPVDV